MPKLPPTPGSAVFFNAEVFLHGLRGCVGMHVTSAKIPFLLRGGCDGGGVFARENDDDPAADPGGDHRAVGLPFVNGDFLSVQRGVIQDMAGLRIPKHVRQQLPLKDLRFFRAFAGELRARGSECDRDLP